MNFRASAVVATLAVLLLSATSVPLAAAPASRLGAAEVPVQELTDPLVVRLNKDVNEVTIMTSARQTNGTSVADKTKEEINKAAKEVGKALNLSPGLIIGISIAAAVVLLLLIICCCCCCCCK